MFLCFFMFLPPCAVMANPFCTRPSWRCIGALVAGFWNIRVQSPPLFAFSSLLPFSGLQQVHGAHTRTHTVHAARGVAFCVLSFFSLSFPTLCETIPARHESHACIVLYFIATRC
uniref:Putative secreted protein n=1 Tax=Anopheles darlingi TaxID=43151 RepID=A0A2M4D876_ANODA